MRSDKNVWSEWSESERRSRVSSQFRRISTAFRWSYLLICRLVVHATRDTVRWLFSKYILDLYVFHVTSVEECNFRQRTAQVRLRLLVSVSLFSIVGRRVLLSFCCYHGLIAGPPTWYLSFTRFLMRDAESCLFLYVFCSSYKQCTSPFRLKDFASSSTSPPPPPSFSRYRKRRFWWG